MNGPPAPTAHLGGKGRTAPGRHRLHLCHHPFLNQARHLELHSALFGLEFKYQQRVAPRLKRRTRSAWACLGAPLPGLGSSPRAAWGPGREAPRRREPWAVSIPFLTIKNPQHLFPSRRRKVVQGFQQEAPCLGTRDTKLQGKVRCPQLWASSATDREAGRRARGRAEGQQSEVGSEAGSWAVGPGFGAEV